MCAPAVIEGAARLGATAHAHQETDDGANQKNDEQNLRDASSADRDSAKAEHSGNQGNDEKDYSIMKHDRTSSYGRILSKWVEVSFSGDVCAVGWHRRAL
jgi:hypothetical protein